MKHGAGFRDRRFETRDPAVDQIGRKRARELKWQVSGRVGADEGCRDAGVAGDEFGKLAVKCAGQRRKATRILYTTDTRRSLHASL